VSEQSLTCYQHIIGLGHFGDESFMQSNTCTGTDNLVRKTSR